MQDMLRAKEAIEKLKKIDYSTLTDLKAQFPDIHPTDREFFSGQLQAYKMAAVRQEREKKEAREISKRSSRKNISTENFKEEMKIRIWERAKFDNFKFVFDDDNREVFDILCEYFTNNPNFEKRSIDGIKYSLNKGILLQSAQRGTGKSFLLNSFNLNPRNSFCYTHVERIRSEYSKFGISAIENQYNNLIAGENWFDFYTKYAGMMFDEIFSERIANHMGNQIFVSEFLINELYDFTKGHNMFWKFHGTTNYDGQAIEDKLGKNIRSRVKEMWNLIKLNGPDRRS